jgi:hypothetical protein
MNAHPRTLQVKWFGVHQFVAQRDAGITGGEGNVVFLDREDGLVDSE